MTIDCPKCGLKNGFIDHDFTDDSKKNSRGSNIYVRKFRCDDCEFTWDVSWEDLGLVDNVQEYGYDYVSTLLDIPGSMVVLKSPTSNTYFICSTKSQLKRFYTQRREYVCDSTFWSFRQKLKSIFT